MTATSSGLVMYNLEKELKVFLAHPGGVFWKNKDFGAWGIPKGLVEENEDIFETAKREFFEETGIKPPENKESYIELETVKLKSGKIVHGWAFQGNFNGEIKCSSMVKLESPDESGNFIEFPEVDKAEFFDVATALKKIDPAQADFIKRLIEKLNYKEKEIKQTKLF